MNKHLQWFVGGLCVALAFAAWFFWQINLGDLGAVGGALVGGLGGLLAWSGVHLINTVRRQAAPMAASVLSADPRPPVLYLRAFSDDERTRAGVTSGLVWGAGALITEEEQLAAAVAAIGPLLAVGRPGEALPELGAARLYVGDDWQQRVSALMRDAALVILRLGHTPGLQWELRYAVETVAPERLVLLCPFDAAGYAAFRQAHEGLFRKGLPDFADSRRFRLGSVRGLLMFEPDGAPRFVALDAGLVPVMRRAATKRLVPYYRYALAPVYARLGKPWTPPPVSAGIVAILALAAAFVLLVAAAVVEELMSGAEDSVYAPSWPTLPSEPLPAPDAPSPEPEPEPIRPDEIRVQE